MQSHLGRGMQFSMRLQTKSIRSLSRTCSQQHAPRTTLDMFSTPVSQEAQGCLLLHLKIHLPAVVLRESSPQSQGWETPAIEPDPTLTH